MISGQTLKRDGQKLVLNNSGQFRSDVIRALRTWLKVRKQYDVLEFRFEEFRQYCELIDVVPHANQAWGSIPALAMKSNLIKPTGRYETAKSLKTHAHKVMIYEII